MGVTKQHPVKTSHHCLHCGCHKTTPCKNITSSPSLWVSQNNTLQQHHIIAFIVGVTKQHPATTSHHCLHRGCHKTTPCNNITSSPSLWVSQNNTLQQHHIIAFTVGVTNQHPATTPCNNFTVDVTKQHPATTSHHRLHCGCHKSTPCNNITSLPSLWVSQINTLQTHHIIAFTVGVTNQHPANTSHHCLHCG